jgi:hypothetical protein
LDLLMAAIAYWILQQSIIASQGSQSVLKKAVGGDWKGKVSPALYVAGIPHEWRAPRAGVVAALRALDFDDFRPQVRKYLPSPGSGQNPRQVEHGDVR